MGNSSESDCLSMYSSRMGLIHSPLAVHKSWGPRILSYVRCEVSSHLFSQSFPIPMNRTGAFFCSSRALKASAYGSTSSGATTLTNCRKLIQWLQNVFSFVYLSRSDFTIWSSSCTQLYGNIAVGSNPCRPTHPKPNPTDNFRWVP